MKLDMAVNNKEPQWEKGKEEKVARKQIVVTALQETQSLLITRHFRISIFIQPT